MIINILYDKSNKLKIYKQSIYIKFVYNANIVNIIRNSFTEKYYHYDKKDKYYQCWELPYNVLDKLKEVLNKYSKINITYNNFRAETMFMSAEKQSIAYRKISYEYLADKFAVEIFNKYAVKILAILNGTTQKEIKSRLTEVKKVVA